MEVVRQIINSNDLSKIVLPESFKNKKVEVTILPFNEVNSGRIKRKQNKKNYYIRSLTEIDDGKISEYCQDIINSDEFKKNLSEIDEKIYKIEDLIGVASKYARHDLPINEIIKKEKEAWAEAMVDKYGQSNG